MKWLVLFLGILANTSASILIKFSVSAGENFISQKSILHLLANPYLFFGIFLYFIAFLLYYVALIYLPLNVAHPILTSGSIAFVSLLSFAFFGENISTLNVIGLVCIVLGVCALTAN